MKIVFSIAAFLFFINGNIFSQDTAAKNFHIDSLPAKGILLDTGWKFHEGDNPKWSNPDLDDSKWQPVTLSDYPTYLPQLKNKNAGWFRLRLLIDSSLLKSQLAIQLSQLGASEIYLNGKLFQRSGVIQTPLNYKSFNPADKPVLLPGNTGNKINIAIRFVTHVPSRTWLFTDASTKRSPLILTVNTWDNSLTNYKTIVEGTVMPPVAYMLLVLAFLFLLLFVFFPKEKINLLFGALCFFLAINAILVVQLAQGSFDISKFGLLSFIHDLNGSAVGTLALLIVSQIVLQRITIYLLIIICGIGIDMLMFFFFGPVKPTIVFDLMSRIAVMTTFFYMCVHAFKQRNYIIGIVALNSAIINIVGILIIIYGGHNLNSFVLFLASTITFTLITFYVSMNFARKSKNLEVQLVEIKNLSQDNLKKEQEKQQILTSQNETLEHQVTERTAALNKSLNDLKSTQAQLIQSEKMASLGELTAGIAHEIQNPLNFVNNFSEVNKEMIAELKEEINQRNYDDAKIIADDIEANEEKINHHGKRADAIVKNMLQHSKQTKGVKEPTDINALCQEYLRLSYHGLRAKDKSFNADFKTEFDNSIGKINIIPQDIGRVLLNLFNNAFYAMNEKKKQMANSYQPIVEVKTRRINDNVEITVTDNGNGIQSSIKEKIFQPFFTTKPTGEGTGLGLSLSYDIIKAHGGEIKVKTEEGVGTDFIILLPIASVGETTYH